jgi:hypothetical protein
MSHPVFSPATMPAQSRPDPLLLFIQQAQMALLYRDESPGSASNGPLEVRVAA